VRFTRLLFSFVLAAAMLFCALTPPATQALAQSAAPIYVLPILDGTVNERRVRDVVDRLGTGNGNVRVGFSGVYRYMAEVTDSRSKEEDQSTDHAAKVEGLERIAAAAKAANAPFLVHLNGGRWAGGGVLVDRLMGDPQVMAWDKDDQPWSYPKDGEYHFSLSSYNELVRKYKQRNLQTAATWLADFKAGPDGHLLVGVSTDSEVLINTHAGYDYNPMVLEEFADWLQGGGVYDASGKGRWAGQGLDLGIKALNERWGTTYRGWKDVKAPRTPSDSASWKDWQRFRALLVDHNVQEQVDWIRAAGLTTVPVFAHQSPALDVDAAADVLDAAQVDGGGTGITTYGENAGNAALFAQVRAYGAPWGIFEYNPRTDDEAAALAALRTTAEYGVAILCPYHWDSEGGDNEVGYTIRDTAFERALKQFVAEGGPAAREQQSGSHGNSFAVSRVQARAQLL